MPPPPGTYLSNDGNVSRVRYVQFFVPPPEVILRRSVVEVTRSETYAGAEPLPNGLFDTRMGVTDRAHTCRTCDQDLLGCPGHEGHITLAKPVFHVKFMGEVTHILRCICYRCSSLLVDPASREVRALLAKRISRQKRFEAIKKMRERVRACPACRARQPDTIKFDDTMKVVLEWRDPAASAAGGRTAAGGRGGAAVGGGRRDGDGEQQQQHEEGEEAEDEGEKKDERKDEKKDEKKKNDREKVEEGEEEGKEEEETGGGDATVEMTQAERQQQGATQEWEALAAEERSTSSHPPPAPPPQYQQSHPQGNRGSGSGSRRQAAASSSSAEVPPPGGAREIKLSAEDVLRLFRRVTEEHAEVMGFSSRTNRPEWLICTVLPVLPPTDRPSVRNDTGQRSEDDITKVYIDIVKYNNALKALIERGASHQSVEWHTNFVQCNVALLVDNTKPNMNMMSKDRSGRVYRTFVHRLKAKEGRIRGNLMGKRVNTSGRTVITPDPRISLDGVGVPYHIAMNLTFPEIVGPQNREQLQRLVDNGPDVHPGAKQVVKAHQGMRTIRLRSQAAEEAEEAGGATQQQQQQQNPDLQLEIGDVVERHMTNDDVVLFNRQPSLHKVSMMAHKVRVMPYKSFRLNVCACKSYNADFDGDEMNMHLPQSLQTREEIRQLAAVAKQVIGPRDSQPIMSIVQDALLGVYRMTQRDVRVSARAFMNLLCSNPGHDGLLPPPLPLSPGGGGEYGNGNSTDASWSVLSAAWTGRQLLSSVIPPDVNVEMGNKIKEPETPGYAREDHHVVIRGGDIRQGIVNGDVYGKQSIGLVHATFNDQGPDAVVALLNNTQKLVCDWLVLSGFSVGVADLVVPKDLKAKLRAHTRDIKQGVAAIIQDVHAGRFENHSTGSDREYFEERVRSVLDAGSMQIEKATLEALGVAGNRMHDMVRSGSKGKPLNLKQMTGSLGQQIVDGRRVADGYDHRSLPHFTKFDYGPTARGFVEHSFVDGLSPHEFFFHSMGGRIGLIDTAVRSVTRDTPLLVVEEDGRCRRVLIGDWIDGRMEAAYNARDVGFPCSEVRRYPEDRNMELLEIEAEVLVPTIDASGRASWGRLTAVTRHDPSERLFRVRTRGGREVTVADSESLLVWRAEMRTFEKAQSSSVRAGVDFLPVVDTLPLPPLRQMPSTTEGTTSSPLLTRFDGGMFLGLFLSNAYRCNDAEVSILTEGIPAIQEFVGWSFEEFGDAASSRHLNELTRDGQRLPEAMFTAPDEAVYGLLSGYFSGRAARVDVKGIGEGCIRGVSVNGGRHLASDVAALLCSRVGVFSEVSSDGTAVSVSSPQTSLLARKLRPVHPERSLKMISLHTSTLLLSQQQHEQRRVNDAVLDPVESIEEVRSVDAGGGGRQQKLYDVTVPSTLNFVLANGLGVRDTSETGYIQRKLVKAMEDCSVRHDLTVRNAIGHVVQFLYGYDGVDCTRLEAQQVPTVKQPDSQLADAHLVAHSEELAPYLDAGLLQELRADEAGLQAQMLEHYRRVHADRRLVIERVNARELNPSVVAPVHVQRVLQNTVQVLEDYGMLAAPSDLDPRAALRALDALLARLRPEPTPLFAALLRCHLSPKVLLARHRLNSAGFERVLQVVEAAYVASVAQPGDVVGVTAAQSIGEMLTQATLNSFHASGTATAAAATQGVARLRELFDVTRQIKTPIMSIRLPPSYSKADAESVMNTIQTVRLRDVVRSTRVFFDPFDDPKRSLAPEDAELLSLHSAHARLAADASCEHNIDDDNEGGATAPRRSGSPWVLRLEFDRFAMHKLQLYFSDIRLALQEYYSDTLSCVFSDDNSARLVARLRLADAGGADGTDRNDLLTEIIALEQSMLDSVKIKGVERVERAMIPRQLESDGSLAYDDASGTFVKTQEWMIKTSGSNMVDVLANPYIDATRTSTNDVLEVFNVFGIEAARAVLFRELCETLQTNSNSISFRHLALLIDTMTNRGHPTGINRSGINKGDIGPLAKCSFEETDTMLLRAGLFCETDRMNGVSANIMLGQVPPCGTGDGDVLMDTDAMLHAPAASPWIDAFAVSEGGRLTMSPHQQQQQKHQQQPAREGDAGRREDQREDRASATAGVSSVAMPAGDEGRVVEKEEDDIIIT